MTNFEKIKAMSLEEMAVFIDTTAKSPCEMCKPKGIYICKDDTDCTVGIEGWLESEAEE